MLIIVLLIALAVIAVLGIGFAFANGMRASRKKLPREAHAPGVHGEPSEDRATGLN